MRHMANKNSLAGEEEEGGAGWRARKYGMLQNEDSLSGGEKVWERQVGWLGNVAGCKRGLTSWRGGRGRNGLVSSETWHITKRGLTSWRGGRGRSGLVSWETGQIAKGGDTSGGGGRGGERW